jgi:hypothetical protein
MKILYVCKSYEGKSDGGAIYDKRLIAELRKKYDDVVVYQIDILKRAGLPFWLKRIQKSDQLSLMELRKERSCIVSHEVLGALAEILRPELFIFHNLFSSFEYSKRPLIQFYYRLGSRKIESRIIYNSKNTLVLSKRELQIATNRYPVASISYHPPGINPYVKYLNEMDEKAIRRLGTSSWLPKRISLLSKTELQLLSDSGYNIVNEDFPKRSISIIEDEFISGFKLKLFDALQRGDVVLSFVDISAEVNTVYPEFKNNLVIMKDRSLLLDYIVGVRLIGNRVSKDQVQQLGSKCSWSVVAEHVVLILGSSE